MPEPEGGRAAVEARFQLANAWLARGKTEAAVKAYLDTLALDPGYAPAYARLASIALGEGRSQAALHLYEQALALDPGNATLRFRRDTLRDWLARAGDRARPAEAGHARLSGLVDNPHGRLNLVETVVITSHRGGWAYAMEALRPLHNRGGVLFDGFIENNFAWRQRVETPRPAHVLERMRLEGMFEGLATAEEQGIIPYRRPWVGVVHNPPGMPAWFHPREAPQAIFARPVWQASLPHCVGLFSLSEHHARWLREQTGKPVSALIHPTEIPTVRFDMRRFRDNPHKRIVQIGWWLRRLNAIYALPIAHDNPLGYEKVRLVPRFFANADDYLQGLLRRERAAEGLALDPHYAENTRDVQHLPNADYDQLLAENIAFVELYDANANNAVIECIARGTPLLVNPLPAVVEYLGENYPLYFTTLDEAAAKAQDVALLDAAHRYLLTCETRGKLSGEYFRASVESSEIYKLIRSLP